MKLLYLDLDGVMCLPEQWGNRFKHKRKFDSFDPKCVKGLNTIITTTDCDIIITSDWRKFGTLEELQWHFSNQKVCKVPIGVTLDLDYDRDAEIVYSLDSYLPSKWVAVDDLPLNVANFVQTKESHGIKYYSTVNKIISYLI